MAGPTAGSIGFADVSINRDSLEPVPVSLPPETLIHRQVCAGGASSPFSASRGHPVFLVSLPSHTVSYSIGELAAGEATSNHRHAYESLIYVLAGEGWTVVEGMRLEWREGDAFYVPSWNWHQHFSAQNGRARYITATNLPLLASLGQTVVRQEDPRGHSPAQEQSNDDDGAGAMNAALPSTATPGSRSEGRR